LSSKQVVEDIERIRQDLFSNHPDTKIYIYGRSGGGYLAQEYLVKYSNNVERAFLRAAPNPLIMENLGYIESKHLINSLNAVDPELQSKLKTIIDRETVPKLELLWLLLRLGYQHQNPGPFQATVINELYKNNRDTYTSYINKGGFSYSQLKENKKLYEQMGAGIYLRAIECDGVYLLGPEPDYIDPVYYCFRDLSSSVFRLIEEKRVSPPTYPSLDKFQEIETEVFYLAGKNDHMSPYQIGIELGKYLKHYELFIADDNHMMMNHKECLPLLRNAFFKFGIGSEQLLNARNSSQCEEWKPE
jgi:pimeloyl-ACP methyl ester carboxylesterase